MRDKKHLHDAMAHELGALPQWQLHDIRRTVATGMQKLGIDEQTYEGRA